MGGLQRAVERRRAADVDSGHERVPPLFIGRDFGSGPRQYARRYPSPNVHNNTNNLTRFGQIQHMTITALLERMVKLVGIVLIPQIGDFSSSRYFLHTHDVRRLEDATVSQGIRV